MMTDARDTGFQNRVHQGHLENFRRKIDSAENKPELESVLSTIEAAATRQMISTSDLDELRNSVFNRRQALYG